MSRQHSPMPRQMMSHAPRATRRLRPDRTCALRTQLPPNPYRPLAAPHPPWQHCWTTRHWTNSKPLPARSTMPQKVLLRARWSTILSHRTAWQLVSTQQTPHRERRHRALGHSSQARSNQRARGPHLKPPHRSPPARQQARLAHLAVHERPGKPTNPAAPARWGRSGRPRMRCARATARVYRRGGRTGRVPRRQPQIRRRCLRAARQHPAHWMSRTDRQQRSEAASRPSRCQRRRHCWRHRS